MTVEAFTPTYGEPLLTTVAYCCTEWTVAIGYPIGRCGYCGQKPTVR